MNEKKEPETLSPHHILSTHRIEALTDGIFAFAMTLLVINLRFPDTARQSGLGLSSLLFGQIQAFFDYFVSFFLLALFWVMHHQQFHHIRRSNASLLWVNILLLSFIVLVPFSTSLTSDFDGQTPAEAFFAANMFIIGLLFLVNWVYSTWQRRFVDPTLEDSFIAESTKLNLVIPAVSLLVFFLAFFIPHRSEYFYLLIPLFIYPRKYWYWHKKAPML